MHQALTTWTSSGSAKSLTTTQDSGETRGEFVTRHLQSLVTAFETDSPDTSTRVSTTFFVVV